MHYSEFLSHTCTYAAKDQDFTEWHHGIPYYGFWAVLITEPSWLNIIKQAQSHLSPFLLPAYARQVHITISASGLLDKQFFTRQDYLKQIQALHDANLSTFSIAATRLNSFQGAPYLSISDSDQQLVKLRSLLGAVTKDDEPLKYRPHITLGFYRDAFSTKAIEAELKKCRIPALPTIYVKQIAFCRYQTKSIQGPIEVISAFQLSEAL